MKKVAILVFAAALVIGVVIVNIFSVGASSGRFFNFSFNFKGEKGSGQSASEARSVSSFKGVDVSGVFQVEITAQKDFAVEVEADDNLLPLIRTEVRNGVLHIETERRVSPRSPMRVRISAPDIDDLDISGVANVSVNDLKNAALNIDSSGASKVKISGNTEKLTVDVSGATKIDAEALNAVNAKVDASGASSVVVTVSGDLHTKASGASKILYNGTPANIQSRTSGAGKVSAK